MAGDGYMYETLYTGRGEEAECPGCGAPVDEAPDGEPEFFRGRVTSPKRCPRCGATWEYEYTAVGFVHFAPGEGA